jgi:hypothetical protein
MSGDMIDDSWRVVPPSSTASSVCVRVLRQDDFELDLQNYKVNTLLVRKLNLVRLLFMCNSDRDWYGAGCVAVVVRCSCCSSLESPVLVPGNSSRHYPKP